MQSDFIILFKYTLKNQIVKDKYNRKENLHYYGDSK